MLAKITRRDHDFILGITKQWKWEKQGSGCLQIRNFGPLYLIRVEPIYQTPRVG